MSRRYHARPGGRHDQKTAETVAAEMNRLDPVGDGVTAREFHLSQKPKRAPLHEEFEWDNKKAADLYRDDQARGLIRCVMVTEEGQSGEPHEARAFLAVKTDTSQPDEDEEGVDARRYRPIALVMADEPQANQILEDALRQLQGWRERWGSYKDLSERFAGVFRAIDEALAAD